jgi:hypothetical protein
MAETILITAASRGIGRSATQGKHPGLWAMYVRIGQAADRSRRHVLVLADPRRQSGHAARDAAPESAARSLRVCREGQDAVRGWRPSPYTGPVDVFGLPPAMARPVTVVQRAHECGADGHLPGALRELIG